MVWQEVVKDSNVWVYEYVANGYKANAFAFALNENDLAVISPPSGLSDADYAELATKGQVMALIAPHSGHDLGLAEWQARYPRVFSYAPQVALNQLKQDRLRPFTPLADLVSPHVELREVPGTKKGGTIAIVRQGARPVVYLDELVMNWSTLPNSWTKPLFWLSGSAPGLKINRLYANLLCPDVKAVAQAVLDALEGDPAIVPAHGAPLVQSGDAERVRALVEPLTHAKE